MVETPTQAAAIGALEPVEGPFAGAIEASVPQLALGADEAAAQHRGQRQRNDARNHDGAGDGDRELMQQAANDPAHEQHRNEDGHQR